MKIILLIYVRHFLEYQVCVAELNIIKLIKTSLLNYLKFNIKLKVPIQKIVVYRNVIIIKMAAYIFKY